MDIGAQARSWDPYAACMPDPDLLRAFAGKTREQIAALVASMPTEMVLATAEALPRASTAVDPAVGDPADFATALDPGYRRRPHVNALAAAIRETVEAAADGSGPSRLIVSMPPQVGKSHTSSLWTPAWYLERHPDRQVILASHESRLAVSFGRQVRDTLVRHADAGRVQVRVARDVAAAGEWETTQGGGMLSRGIGGSITGRGAHLLLIDDPLKGFAEAHSLTIRQAQWSWWLSVAQTRLRPGAAVIVVMCMTGDTPVLRPDGTATPLRDIRPGDRIATYERGRLTTSTVRNWANQGPDDVFAIRMESGRVVRANARHPFLTVDEDGNQRWQRTDSLKPGTRILTATGVESHAPPTTVTDPSRARASAPRTTTRPDGQADTDLPRPTPKPAAPRASSTATASPPRTTTGWSPSRTASAPSADRSRPTAQPTGAASSASTTTTKPGPSADSCATTATSSSSATSPRPDSTPPLSTWNVTPDTVVEVVPAGREDVYDIQVDRTENFIANGLVSHNTRWHEDDLAGRLLSGEHEGDPDEWRVVRIPAFGEGDVPDDGVAPDALGRDYGVPIATAADDESVDAAAVRWEGVRQSVGPYVWAGLYQQRPSEPEGTVLKRGWWQYYRIDRDRLVRPDGSTVDVSDLRIYQSWDLAFKDRSTSDWVVGQVWGSAGPHGDRFLLDQVRDRLDFVATKQAVRRVRDRWPSTAATWVEDKANGPAIIAELRREISGLVPVNPRGSKEARAWATTGDLSAGNIWLPAPEDAPWVRDFVEEAAAFPNGAHDDQVDAFTQAIDRMRATGGVERPKGSRSSERPSVTSLTQRRVTRN